MHPSTALPPPSPWTLHATPHSHPPHTWTYAFFASAFQQECQNIVGMNLIPILTLSSMFSSISAWFAEGMMMVFIPAQWAARIFSFRLPTGRTWPTRDISPVIAVVWFSSGICREGKRKKRRRAEECRRMSEKKEEKKRKKNPPISGQTLTCLKKVTGNTWLIAGQWVITLMQF